MVTSLRRQRRMRAQALYAMAAAAASTARTPPPTRSQLHLQHHRPAEAATGGRPRNRPLAPPSMAERAAAAASSGEAEEGRDGRRPPPPQRQQRRRRRRAAEESDEAPILPAGPEEEGGELTSQRLKADLLSGYDRMSFPWSEAWSANSTAAAGEGEEGASHASRRFGVTVELSLNFHRVFAVDVSRSTAELVVWIRQRWVDPRLSWDPAEYGNVTTVHFWIGEGSGPGGEMSEIWTPDLELWNLESGLADSFSDAAAAADPTGTVYWSRPGHLRSVCKFRGLDAFPFDELGCTVEIGSWAHSGLYIRPVLMGDGYSIGGSATAGESFAEFQLGPVSAREHLYPPYPASPEEDWPVVLYDITFRRAWQPYARGYLILQIVLNLAAFACFWLPPQSGERMDLAITALLAAVASELVVSANLPSASELTWFATFSIVSLVFAAAALFESAAVIYFFYLTADSLVPGWVIWLRQRWAQRRNRKRDGGDGDGKPSSQTEQGLESPGDECQDESSDEFEDNVKVGDKILDKEGAGLSARLDIGTKDENIECKKEDGHHVRFQDEKDTQNEAPSIALSKESQGSFAHDADDYKTAAEAENNLRWQRVARGIDEVSRMVFPVAFAIALAVMLGPHTAG